MHSGMAMAMAKHHSWIQLGPAQPCRADPLPRMRTCMRGSQVPLRLTAGRCSLRGH